MSKILSVGSLRMLGLKFILLLMLVKGASGVFHLSCRSVLSVLLVTK